MSKQSGNEWPDLLHQHAKQRVVLQQLDVGAQIEIESKFAMRFITF